jgi:hypothetical protein
VAAGDDWIIWIAYCCAHYCFAAAVRRKSLFCRAIYVKKMREKGVGKVNQIKCDEMGLK